MAGRSAAVPGVRWGEEVVAVEILVSLVIAVIVGVGVALLETRQPSSAMWSVGFCVLSQAVYWVLMGRLR